jgi:hypothetical protein
MTHGRDDDQNEARFLDLVAMGSMSSSSGGGLISLHRVGQRYTTQRIGQRGNRAMSVAVARSTPNRSADPFLNPKQPPTPH